MTYHNPLNIIFRKSVSNKLDWVMIAVFGSVSVLLIVSVIVGAVSGKF